jgi:riboflavin biosynthesis pyrimidine reductase
MPPEASDARLAVVTEPVEDDYPWPDAPWMRALFVMALDGAESGPDGRSGSISGPSDREVLGAIRRWSDAVIVGASTMRIERYNPMRTGDAVARQRREQGRLPAPRLVVVSSSLDLPWSDPVYSESTMRPLIVTSESASVQARRSVPDTCDLLVAPGDRVPPEWLRQRLVDMGLVRMVCEGGRALLADFVRADVVDEWALTLSGRIQGREFAPVWSRCEDEFVFTRFLRQGGHDHA